MEKDNMATEALLDNALTAFGTRLFAAPGRSHITEISEFQAQAWRLGKDPIHFQVALCGGPAAQHFQEYFQALSEVAPHITEDALPFRRSMWGTGNARKFSLLILPLKSAAASVPLAMATLSMSLTKAKSGKPEWLYAVCVEALCLTPQNSHSPADYMVSAAISDMLYDELNMVSKQAKAAGISGSLRIAFTYPKDRKEIQVIASRTREEVDTVRHLINSTNGSANGPGLRILPAAEI